MNKKKFITAKNPYEVAKLLDLSPEDAAKWEIETKIIDEIKRIMKAKKLTQEQVAQKAHCSRRHVVSMLNYDADGITLDFMYNVLTSLGYKAELKFSKIA